VLAVFGHDALAAELAGMGEYSRAVAFKMLAVLDAGLRFGEHLFEPSLALLERPWSPVLAFELQ